MFDRHIRFSAQLSPSACAVSNGPKRITFLELDQTIDRLAGALSKSGAQRQRLISVCVADTYHHLLLILACARLGVATVSVSSDMVSAAATACGDLMLLSDQLLLRPEVHVDANWLLSAISSSQGFEPTSPSPHELARVQLTSGSSGEPKAVALSWGLFERRVEHTWVRHEGYERLLSLVGPESGSLPLYIWCWARGGCALFGGQDMASIARALPALQPTGILASPTQLAGLLDRLPNRFDPPHGLRVGVVGARIGRRLAERAAMRLGSVDITYASTEAGVCAIAPAAHLLDENVAGWVVPWTKLEIVDATLEPVAAGTVGRIRIAGSDVVEAYLPSQTSFDRFAEGWFYPGDLGAFNQDGSLSVVGREDELMNFGGEKILPNALEEPVRRVQGVADAAVFSVENADGIPTPWLALVRDGEVADGAIEQALRGFNLPPIRIVWVDALPVSPMGKIRRDVLRTAAVKHALQDMPK